MALIGVMNSLLDVERVTGILSNEMVPLLL